MPRHKDFPALIRWIAATHHDGVVDAIAERAKISGALADKWVKGKVRAPRLDTLLKLCAAYDLNFNEVVALAYGRMGKRGAAILSGLALLVLLGSSSPAYAVDGGSGQPQPTNAAELRLIGSRRRRWTQWLDWLTGWHPTASLSAAFSQSGNA